jgi:hypothetical protein
MQNIHGGVGERGGGLNNEDSRWPRLMGVRRVGSGRGETYTYSRRDTDRNTYI